MKKSIKVACGQGTLRCLDLRPAGHDNRTEPRRLFPRQQDGAEGCHLRDERRNHQGSDSGRCDAFTTDASGLYAERLRLAKPDDHMVLPEIISKEPLGPGVRHGDDQWHDIVMWTHYAMVTAEELGVTKANVDERLKSENPDIKRLLGTEGKHGEALGLTNAWAYQIIKHVGNYGESFDRTVGAGSPLKIGRGLNNLWNKGGLQYAPPIR